MPRKIIIDTDPGIDDAMAIFFALHSPELDVIGLTTIFGNVTSELATTNALRLLEIAGRQDIPVARGADDPIALPFGGAVPIVHGEDGQGNVFLPPPTTHAIDQNAAQFIIEQVMSQPGEVTLVPIGPLTNIALALRIEPRIAQHVREVVLMGGNALGPGNATPSAEANIHNDPEAADVVLGAPWRVTMVGLDVTNKVIMHADQLAEYGRVDTPTAQHIAHIAPYYLDFYRKRHSMNGICIHDSSAIAYLINPSLFRTEAYPVRVDAGEGIGRGKTWPALGPVDRPSLTPWRDRPLVHVCVEVQGEAVVALELSRMRG